jgi:hypothetical protein
MAGLKEALDRLDPGDRALIELSVQRGIPDRELAQMLGTDAADIGKRRGTVLEALAVDTGRSSEDIEAALRDHPAGGAADADDDEEAHEDAAAAVHGGESRTERRQESRAGFLRSNSLSIFFLTIFFLALAGQSVAGWKEYNESQLDHEESQITYGRYLTSSHFGQAVAENWQSEYLQFVLYIMATIWFVQRGSPESKTVRDQGREDSEEQEMGSGARPDSPGPAKREKGLYRLVYSNSLLFWMGLIWLGSWFAQSVTGWSTYNSDQIEHREAGTNWIGYVQTPDFWEATLQNWQSEFLAVGSMAIFAVYLRQRGSPESKPVGAPHDETAATG